MTSGQPGATESAPRREAPLPTYEGNVEIGVGADSKSTSVTLVKGKDSNLIPTRDGSGEIVSRSLEVGIGNAENFGVKRIVAAARKLVRIALEKGQQTISVAYAEFRERAKNISDYTLGKLLGEQMTLASYEFTMYRTQNPPERMTRIVLTGALPREAEEGMRHGVIVAREINYARDMVNMPANDLTPANFAEAGRRMFEGTKVVYKVMTASEIRSKGMELIETVGKGSENEPRFVVAEYWGAESKSQRPTVLVGKGITFDTGGNSIKYPSTAMHDMYSDMAGGAAVLASVAALAKIGAQANVVGIVAMAENSVSGGSARPSDISGSAEGKTVHVDNTDAEGRLVLADAVAYANKEYDAESVVTVATLTGAAIVTAGKKQSLMIAKDSDGELMKDAKHAGDETGTPAQPYVVDDDIWEAHKSDMDEKGNKRGADISNTGRTGESGATYGAVFINSFVGDRPHLHIDMAGRALVDGEGLSGGATGEPTSLLVNYVKTRQNAKRNV